jgi:hypothetical protein
MLENLIKNVSQRFFENLIKMLRKRFLLKDLINKSFCKHFFSIKVAKAFYVRKFDKKKRSATFF